MKWLHERTDPDRSPLEELADWEELVEEGYEGELPRSLRFRRSSAPRAALDAERPSKRPRQVRGGGVESAEARAAASSLEKEIDEAIRADPEMRSRAEMKPSDWRLHGSKRTTGNSYIKGAKWNEEQGRTMERQGVKTLRDLALVNMDIRELALALTLSDDTKAGRRTARRMLWRRKGAAAALLGVDDIGELQLKTGRKLKDVAEPEEKKQRR